MKRILSLILATAIILSCFATSIIFNVGAATGVGDYVDVLAMGGYNYNLDKSDSRILNISDAVGKGSTTGKTTSFSTNTERKEIGQPYMSLYNLADGTADPENSVNATKCYGVYEVKSNSGTYICDTAAPDAFLYQTKLRATTENAVIVYIELPDYKANGTDWGFGIAKRGDGSKNYYEFDIGQSGWGAYLNRTADNTTGFSYLPVGEAEWINGTVYAEEDGARVMKTDLPSGFKGYVRFDLSKFDYMSFNEKTANSYMSGMLTLTELNFAYNGITETDILTIGGLMYVTTANVGRILKFKDGSTAPLTEAISDQIHVLAMGGYDYAIDKSGNYRVVKVTDAAPNGNTAGKTTSFAINTDRKEIGQAYTSLYNSGTEVADPENSDNVAKCYGVYEVKSNTGTGTFINDVTSPEIFTYQTKLRATTENAVIVYIELPDYKANGTDWGFGIAKRGNGSAYEFDIGQSGWGAFLNRKADNTTGFSYLPVGEDEWVNGTVYAEEAGTRVMKTDLPSGFKGYVRFDLSKFDYMAFNEKNANSYMPGMTTLKELNFAYNGVTETDILTVGGLMYITTPNDGKVLNFKNAGYAPIVSNTIQVRSQNLITDTANETNVTGTNIKLGYRNTNDGTIRETDDVENRSFVAQMKLTKSGGLFLDDGYAGAIRPSSNQGSNVLLAGNTNYLNYLEDDNLNLKLKAGVNKFMFYVELPDVRALNNVTDDSMALALRPIIIDNQYTMKPYGLTYQFMDIREGVWHDGTISDGTEDPQKITYGTLNGLPTDGFKGYIKIDLDPIINNKTKDFIITKIQIGVSRAAWGAPVVIGGFYAVDVDNTDSTAYFMDSETGEMLTTKVLAGDFSGDEKYDATDLALAIKYLIKHPDVTGAQTARASAFNNPKADFNTVSLVQLKKKILGIATGFSIDTDLEASTSESDVLLTAQNPDRGFRYQSHLSINMDYGKMPEWNLTQWDDKFKAAADKTNPNAWVNPNITKLYFPLSSFAESDITEDAFKNMERAFEIVRKQGRTAIVRFWYEVNFEPDEEGTLVNGPVPEDKMLAHMQQIKDNGILERNKDILNSVEAGFLGRYGEWHTYYDNYWQYKDEDGNLLIDTIWEKEGYNEEAIIRGILDMTPDEVYVLLRTSIYRDKFLASTYKQDGDAERLGLMNDSFYGMDEGRPSSWPLGSHTSDAAISTRNAAAIAPMSGEFFWGQEFERNGYDRVTAESAILGFKYYHQNTFSIFHNSWEGTEEVAGTQWYRTSREGDMAIWARTAITEDWLKENNVFYAPGWFKDANGNTVERTQFEFVRDYLGYKLEAKHLKVTGNKARGADVDVEVSLVNYGFSAPFNMTSEIVVLDNNNKIVSRVDAGNALDWVNTDTVLKTHTINATITLPETAGRYKIALYVHNRAGTGAYLGNNIEQVNGFNILTSFGI